MCISTRNMRTQNRIFVNRVRYSYMFEYVSVLTFALVVRPDFRRSRILQLVHFVCLATREVATSGAL